MDEKELLEREQALKEKENRMTALAALRQAGLDDSLADLVIADTEEEIRSKVGALDGLVKGMVQKKVEKVFKDSGRIPGMGAGAALEEGTGARLNHSAARIKEQSRVILDYYKKGGR